MKFIEKILVNQTYYELWLKRFIYTLLGFIVYYFFFRLVIGWLGL